MNSSQAHLSRNNRVLFITYIVSGIFLTIGLISQLTMSEFEPFRSIIPLLIALIMSMDKVSVNAGYFIWC